MYSCYNYYDLNVPFKGFNHNVHENYSEIQSLSLRWSNCELFLGLENNGYENFLRNLDVAFYMVRNKARWF